MSLPLSRARLEIDLGAIQRNATAVARRAGVPLLPMVKADAYGLGVREIVGALESLQPWGYGIASVDEGQELREAGITKPIVVFTPLLEHDLKRARAARLTPTLGFAHEIEAWRSAGGGAWHFAIDTGMSRAGIPWREVERVRQLLEVMPAEGAFTHFHSSELDDGTMELQENIFGQGI